MALDARPKPIPDLPPEARAKVEARLAAWHSPEARAEEIRDRDELAEEFRQTGTITERTSMPEKSPRRLMLEASLAEDPADSFLRYGLAVQCLRDGDTAEGRERLQSLIGDNPTDQVAAHQMLGQSYLESGEADQARAILEAGIALAGKRGDWHASSEMEGLLAQLG